MYQRNSNCPSLIAYSNLNTIPPTKSLMLRTAEWKNIIKHLSPSEEDTERLKRTEEEKQYENYLKSQSQAMTQNWDNTIEKQIKKQNAERDRQQREKVQHGERLYREMKETDRNNRKELIEYAESLMQRLKAGPQQLENAFALTEVIEQQRLQREARAEAYEREQTSYMADGMKQMEQAQQWIQDQVEQVRNRTARCQEYKKTLVDDIRVRETQRQNENKHLVDEEKAEIDAQTKQQHELMAKEKSAMQQKKEQLRKNSFDSFRSVRQRQLKDDEFRRIEQDKINAYHQLKNERETRQKLAERERKARRTYAIEKLGIHVVRSLPDVEGAEEKCYQKAIKQFASQWDEQEQKRKGHTARMRDDRLLHQIYERTVDEKQKQQQIKENEISKIVRLKNEEIDCRVDIQRRIQRANTNRELKNILSNQVDERKVREQMEITDDSKYFRDENRKDDEHFLKYADKMLKYAQKKGRVSRPLIRVINEYKEKHALLPPKIELPHLRSQVGIGVAEKKQIAQK